jgi:multimeric flavodoxin WrbA
MPNILILTASPIKDGSTDILLWETAKGIIQAAAQAEPMTEELIRLNDYHGLPCQACGQSPEPEYCIYHDDIYTLYKRLINCDIVLFGSPVYFDTVSAQAKIFIDRCNCLRPLNFDHKGGDLFRKIITKKRLGAIILVGGERENFECARKVIAGFYKWVEIENIGTLVYGGTRYREIGPVRDNQNKLKEAGELGRIIYEKRRLGL